MRARMRSKCSPTATAHDPGFFEASGAAVAALDEPRRRRLESVVVLFDTSLSMQWEKLERSFHALESLLRSLQAGRPVQSAELQRKSDAVCARIPWLRGSGDGRKSAGILARQQLRGGTNLQAALDAALAQTFANDPYIVV